jgi:hypothetical protein
MFLLTSVVIGTRETRSVIGILYCLEIDRGVACR